MPVPYIPEGSHTHNMNPIEPSLSEQIEKVVTDARYMLLRWVEYHEGGCRGSFSHPFESARVANRYREYTIAKRIYG